jgi:hypothetical protein
VTTLADQHYWHTADGRYVPTGHLDAETLAYAKGDELPDEVALAVGLLDPPKPPAKQAERPADKSRARSGDK